LLAAVLVVPAALPPAGAGSVLRDNRKAPDPPLPTGARARLEAVEPGGGEPIFSLSYSPDGRTLAASGYEPVIRLWDMAASKERRQLRGHAGAIRWDHAGTVRCVAFSPDGRLLASAGSDRKLRLWDVAAGKELWATQAHRFGLTAAAFSPDGKVLATAGGIFDPAVKLWDVATGKELRASSQGEAQDGAACVAFSPDGKTLAYGTVSGLLCTMEADTGKDLLQVSAHRKGVNAVQYSPDGPLLATAGGDRTMRLWDPARGTEVRKLSGHDGPLHALAFSRDGKILASGGADRAVVLWEVLTGHEVRRLEGHQEDVKALAFAPDGRTLASGGTDGVIFLWDPAGVARVPSAAELEALWADLAGADAPRAYRAVCALAAAPNQAVGLLARHLKPAPPEQAARVARLIAGLDSDRFEVRKKATEDLRKIGLLAEPALERALSRHPTPEARQRMEALLQELRRADGPPELLRIVRAVQVLEQAATPEAQRLLREWAAGAPDERLTQEAKEALRRLAKASASPATSR
jgi:hypothetical protein